MNAITLPADVHLVDDGIHDSARGTHVPLNRTALYILHHVLGGQPIHELAVDIAEHTRTDPTTVINDILRLISQLHRQHLINVDSGSLLSGSEPTPTEPLGFRDRVRTTLLRTVVSAANLRHRSERNSTRHALDASSPGRLARSLVSAAAPTLRRLAMCALAPLVVLLTITTGVGGLVAGTLVSAGLLASIVVHEYAHALAARRHTRPYLVTSGFGLAIVTHNDPRPHRTAAAGPVTTSLAGLLLLAIGALLPSQAGGLVFTLLAIPFAMHVTNLTAPTLDGRHLTA